MLASVSSWSWHGHGNGRRNVCIHVASLLIRDIKATWHAPPPKKKLMSNNIYNSMRARGGQCHVYMVLPGETRFTTAGRYEIESDRDEIPQGRFVYCRSFLDNPDAVPIDPVDLDKLDETVYRTTMFNGVFSSLRDSAPQGWGRNLIKHTSFPELNDEIDYLLQSPDDRVGALGFGHDPEPPDAERKFYRIADLERLAALAEILIVKDEIPEGTDESDRILDMVPLRTSMGGNRPKAIVEDSDGLWLAKFERGFDRINHVRIERAMLELAELCGIRCARSRVETFGGRDVLLVRRFDREKTDRGYLRSRMISGYTMLRTDDTPENRKGWHYALLAEELRCSVAKPEEDSKELFRRMVFNALISKTDDGPQNHAIIAKRAEWKLSPAYDLEPKKKQLEFERRDLAMNCGIHGRQANATNLLSECERFRLGNEEAAAIIDAMEERVANSWYRIARNAGVSETDCETIGPAIAYPGFRREPEITTPC